MITTEIIDPTTAVIIQVGEDKFFTLKFDAVFKTVLINEKFKPLMNKMLSDILEEPIEIIGYYPPEMPSQNFNAKSNRLDIVAETKDHKLVNIEINSEHNKYVQLRNLLFYTAMYTQTIKIGRKNFTEINTVQVNLNFGQSKNKPLKRVSHIRYDDTNEIFSDTFKIVDVNVDKYKSLWYDKNIKGELDHIYIVMLAAGKNELIELGKQDEMVEEVKDIMIRLNDNGTFTRLISEEEEKEYFKQMELNDAREEGEQKGALEEKRNMVRTLLSKKYKIEEIIDITGLTKEEILKIQENTDTDVINKDR